MMIAVLQHRAGELIQDRYEVESVLGAGAFGTVYRCRDRELDLKVAIKELHVLDDPASGLHEREAAHQQFRREAIHLSHLRHPHIVSGHYQRHSGTWLICPVCGYSFRGTPTCPEDRAAPVVLQQRHYLVMEYVDGPNLDEAARQAGGALPVAAALRYIRQIATALQLIHARGWLHRDIKPENIRVRQDSDDAVLLDFGIATESGAPGDFSTRRQRHTTGGGTLGYAPDAPQERRLPDARSDIHALGMTLYRLVSGLDPQEPADLVKLRTGKPRDFNTAVPPDLEALILKAIDPDPAQRPQDVAAFLQEMTETPEGSTPPATPPTKVLTAPLTFRAGEAAHELREIVALMDKYPDEAKQLLYRGVLDQWLEKTGHAELAARAKEIRVQYKAHKERGVEAFMQATGLAAVPQMQAHPLTLDFGVVQRNEKKTLILHLHNGGRGHLFGLLRPPHEGLVCPAEFDGNHATLPITLDASRLKAGEHWNELTIDSSAGELRVPFLAIVRPGSSFVPTMTIVLWAVLGMFGGYLLRDLPFLFTESASPQSWLAAESKLGVVSVALFGLACWGVLLLIITGEATRRRSCALFLTAASLSLPLGVLCAVRGEQLLIAGDLALRPQMEPLVHHWATGGWMFAGGILGAMYGTLRRVADLFSVRVVHILLGWILAFAILCGALIGLGGILIGTAPPRP
ncbi:MAG TPA: serine/threonine-protein kinase [Abditibacteriaceae bacterium]|nr:serine/threonine-protein kinase [Abditibacteriaceae bacterium]